MMKLRLEEHKQNSSEGWLMLQLPSAEDLVLCAEGSAVIILGGDFWGGKRMQPADNVYNSLTV